MFASPGGTTLGLAPRPMASSSACLDLIALFVIPSLEYWTPLSRLAFLEMNELSFLISSYVMSTFLHESCESTPLGGLLAIGRRWRVTHLSKSARMKMLPADTFV